MLEGFDGMIGDIAGSIDSFMPAGDLRPLAEVDFTEIPAAVIGIRDGGARVEVSVEGERGRSWSIINWVGFWDGLFAPEDFVRCDCGLERCDALSDEIEVVEEERETGWEF